MGLLIELVLRIFISALNQFTKQDLNEFIDQFPKEVGRKIGEAAKGNLEPITTWLSESTSNLHLFISALTLKKGSRELTLQDKKMDLFENLIKAVLEGIDSIKKPLVLKEFFGNINYYSLWQIEGYTHNAFSKTSVDLIPNTHFHIYLIEPNKVTYKKLLRLISNSHPIPKKVLKKSLRVKKIEPTQVTVATNKWIKRKKTIPLNFSTDSYLSLLADIQHNIERSTNPTTWWEKFKNLFWF